MSQNLSSAAVVIGTLRVNSEKKNQQMKMRNYAEGCFLQAVAIPTEGGILKILSNNAVGSNIHS